MPPSNDSTSSGDETWHPPSFPGNGRTCIADFNPYHWKWEKYWSTMFETPSAVDNRAAATPSAVHWSFLYVGTPSEVTAALKSMMSSAPGLDHIPAADLTWHQPSLAVYFNLLLAARGPPDYFACSRVIFLPKTDAPSTPGDYRPIFIISTILHKILACRLRPSSTGFSSRMAALRQ